MRSYHVARAALFVLFTCFAVSTISSSAASAKSSNKSDDNRWTVLFRGDDSSIWGTAAGKKDARNGYSIAKSSVPDEFKYLRLKRLETGDSVDLALPRKQLYNHRAELDDDVVWKGEIFTDRGTSILRLGICRLSWPTAVGEAYIARRGKSGIDDGYRGWGFGHVRGANKLEYCWEGKPIKKTVFEIAVTNTDLTSDESAALLTSGSGSSVQSVVPTSGKPLPILRRQATVKALYVRLMENGQMLGLASDLILTATPGKPPASGTPVVFPTRVGSQMKLVLDDVLRAIRVNYPSWEASKVELTFEDKYTPKDGGSIGAAIGVLLRSMLNGFDIDPAFALTGDITADGKVRRIGGVAAKIRGASEAKCELIGLPEDNSEQLTDAMVWEGVDRIAGIQAFAMKNLNDAVALARIDREAALADAIRLFAEVQQSLKKSPAYLKTPEAVSKLQQVLEKAPNHLSAKLLLQVAEGKAPRQLSAAASQYYTYVAVNTVTPMLFEQFDSASKHGKLTKVNHDVVENGLRDLEKVHRVSAPEMLPLVDAWRDYISSLEKLLDKKVSGSYYESKRQALLDIMEKQKVDQALLEKMLHEGI
jgi:hypothetical protein